MRIYEAEAKRVLGAEGIAVPRSYGVVRAPGELADRDLPLPMMVKAQALVGGRGKAGGVRRVGSLEEAAAVVEEVLGLHIGTYPVESVLLEEVLAYSAACYLGVTVDPATGNNVVIASAAGGVDIEEVARTRPEAILRVDLPENPDGLPMEVVREIGAFLARDLGEDGARAAAVAQMLYAVYQRHDCKVVEINPLLITAAGPVAADAKMVLDDNALYRQGRLLASLGIIGKRHDVAEPTGREQRAAAAGFPYVDLLVEDAEREHLQVYVGLVPGGAGYGIFSIDEVTNVGDRYFDGRAVPVNFMDSGGGPSQAAVAEMFALLMDYDLVDLIITSRFGGISSCDTFIRGLVDCLRDRRATGQRVLPVYGRMVGTDLPAARAYLEQARRETPEDLTSLRMVVGNRKIMAEVIRDGLADFLAGDGEVGR
ncbi:MAG: hypothetical protein JRJ84_08920 [Deltaproteobacteria bacterium]|nr:hypothetical protein [Deltaproteobacteria bacterium]